jgi:hypothetical protein
MVFYNTLPNGIQIDSFSEIFQENSLRKSDKRAKMQSIAHLRVKTILKKQTRMLKTQFQNIYLNFIDL